MSRFKTLSHTIRECKYHVVFCPKYRYRTFSEYAKQEQIYVLCKQKEMVMQATIKRILNAVVVIAVILWLLSVFGLIGNLSRIRIGK